MNLKLYSLSVKEGLKMSKIIDTHTHIYDEQFQEDFNDVMKNIEEQMEGIVSIGFDMESSLKSIELAERVKLPIVIHTREALQDTLDILKEYPNVGGILHCYPGSFQAAKPFLDRYYIGVGGTVTFKNNRKTKELVKELPLDRIVLETDCPYLTPVPFRGKRNQPVYTKYVAEEIAAIKEISVEEVIKVTTENAKKIYNL